MAKAIAIVGTLDTKGEEVAGGPEAERQLELWHDFRMETQGLMHAGAVTRRTRTRE